MLSRVATSGIGGELRPGIVHRLDRGTSGVMVVAKNDMSHQDLARQFHDREVEKEYIALVWGLVQQGRRIDEPIGRDPSDRQKMSTRARRLTSPGWRRSAPLSCIPGIAPRMRRTCRGGWCSISTRRRMLSSPR